MSTYNITCGKIASPYSKRKHKITYASLEDAMNARSKQLKQGRNQRPYKCKSCGYYHLTSN